VAEGERVNSPARATGCALLPVYLPRTSRGYAAQILPPVQYDRREIGSREARIQLTQKIMQRFEPAIRLYATQWFHFVPIWPR
jgi:lauroyl/myristoyl acyltransferase